MNIGLKIKQRRVELGWSQRELSKRMGYQNHTTLTKIESGQVDVSQSRIVQFADVLNVSIPYLMGWDEEEQKEKPVEDDGLSENVKKLIDFAKAVPDDKVELVLKLMRTIVEDD